MENDYISRQAMLKHIEKKRQDALMIDDLRESNIIMMGTKLLDEAVWNQPSTQPDDWMERNKERILQAGMEGREIEFRIGGRLFAIREKAQ